VYDRGDKFGMYRMLSSLEMYVLIAADRMAVEVRAVQPDGTWRSADFCMNDEVVFPGINCRCPITAFYEDVAL
ncbi:MAG: Uma2 family endonuclease, partial [Chloroflexota bacterium]